MSTYMHFISFSYTHIYRSVDEPSRDIDAWA